MYTHEYVGRISILAESDKIHFKFKRITRGYGAESKEKLCFGKEKHE